MANDPGTSTDPILHVLQLIAGDFFQSVPEGADFYVMRSVIHNWSDDQVIAILKNCRAAMAEGGKVVMIGQAGLRMTRIVPTSSFMQVVEAVAAAQEGRLVSGCTSSCSAMAAGPPGGAALYRC